MKKELTKGQYTLIHERYIDDMGFERDSFDFFDSKTRTHHPFMGKIVVTEFLKDSDIRKLHFTYSEEDYEEMFNEQFNNLSFIEEN